MRQSTKSSSAGARTALADIRLSPIRTSPTSNRDMQLFSMPLLYCLEVQRAADTLGRMQGVSACISPSRSLPESRGGALWPSEVSKAQLPEGFDTLYWVLLVENRRPSGERNQSNSNHQEMKPCRNNGHLGTTDDPTTRRLQPQTQRPQFQREARGQHRPMLSIRMACSECFRKIFPSDMEKCQNDAYVPGCVRL